MTDGERDNATHDRGVQDHIYYRIHAHMGALTPYKITLYL